MNYHFKRLEAQKVHFSRALFYPEMQLLKKENKVAIVFKTPNSSDKMELNKSDGKNPSVMEKVSSSDTLYLERTNGREEKTYTYSLVPPNAGKTFTYELTANSCLSMPIELLTKPDSRYPGDGAFTLTNGVRGSIPWKGNEWLGFDEEQISIKLDLKKKTMVSGFQLGFLNDESSWIHYPKGIRVFVSKNNKKWREVEDYVESHLLGEMRSLHLAKKPGT